MFHFADGLIIDPGRDPERRKKFCEYLETLPDEELPKGVSRHPEWTKEDWENAQKQFIYGRCPEIDRKVSCKKAIDGIIHATYILRQAHKKAHKSIFTLINCTF